MMNKFLKYIQTSKELKKWFIIQFASILIFLAIFQIIVYKYRVYIEDKVQYYIQVETICGIFILISISDIYIQLKIHSKNQSINELLEVKDKLNEEIIYRKNLEQKLLLQFETLQENERTHKLVLDGANDAIWQCNIETKHIYISKKWANISGYDIDDVINAKKIKNIIYAQDIENIKSDYNNYICQKTLFFQSEFRIKTKDKDYKWVYVRGKALRNEEGKPIKLAGSLTDITERKNIESQMRQMAYFDSLTNLPNKTFFMSRLESVIKESIAVNNKGAVIFVDLDNLKKINDTLGHDYGNQLLKIVSNVLEFSVNESNNVARIGGDEFLILLPNISNRNDVVKVCKKIIDTFKNPIELGEKNIYTSASMGISVFPEDGNDIDVLLKNADTAMYKSKTKGKNKYSFFDENMSNEISRKAQIEKCLRKALDKNEFQVYYQPQVDVKTGCIKGLEALLRWDNDEMGRVSPVEFIPVAEETGLIISIGEWVIKTVCKKSKEWNEKNFSYEKIAINVSSIQLQYEDFQNSVMKIITDTGVNPKCIEFEITESVLVKCSDEIITLMNNFRTLGIGIALDDFGTGYSSLNHLKLLPIDTLKIDKFFIDNIEIDFNDKAITEGIIKLAHSINVRVVVEGVETKEQAKLLENMVCDEIQGYYYYKPLPEEEIEKLLMLNKN